MRDLTYNRGELPRKARNPAAWLWHHGMNSILQCNADMD